MNPTIRRQLRLLAAAVLFGLQGTANAALLDQSLTGTVVVEGGRSFALFQPGDGLILVREGDEVVRGIRLVQVRTDRVVLEEDGQRREVRFGGIPASQAVAEEPGAPDTASPDPVTQLSDSGWRIDKKALANTRLPLAQVMAQLRVLPHQTDGNPDGLQLADVDPGGLVYRLGFRPGDVIRRINGTDTRYMEQTYLAYQRAVRSDEVLVDFVREGKPLTFRYSLH